MERRLALWLRRFSACLARFLAEGVLATVELLEKNWVNSEQIKAANNAVAQGLSRGCACGWKDRRRMSPAFLRVIYPARILHSARSLRTAVRRRGRTAR